MADTPAIAELKRLLPLVTQGEWTVEYDNDTGPNDEGFWEWWTAGPVKADDEPTARFIAAAKNAMPKLIALHDAALAMSDAMHKAEEQGADLDCVDNQWATLTEALEALKE